MPDMNPLPYCACDAEMTRLVARDNKVPRSDPAQSDRLSRAIAIQWSIDQEILMKMALAALCCTLALTGATALAQQPQNSGTSGNSSASGPTLTDKLKQAAKTLGEKTKETAQTIKEKAQQTTKEAKTPDSAGQSTSSKGAAAGSTAVTQMQAKADADFKSAKAKCGSIEDKSQKSVCHKQAVAAHANAEVKTEKAKAANHGSTANMGAGKSSQ